MAASMPVDQGIVQAIGRHLLQAARQQRPNLYRGISGALLRRTLNDAALRSALFRFIDVLPQLHDSRAQSEHLNACLDEAEGALATLLRLSARPSLIWLAKRQISQMGRNFLVEENATALASAMQTLRPASVSLDAVGEAVLTEAEADAYRDRALWQLAQDWQGQAPHLSIKLTALAPGFDPLDAKGTCQRVFSRLAPIIASAENYGATITVDMEHYELKQQIVALFVDAVVEFGSPRWQPAIALQAYLPETGDDLKRVLDAAQRSGRKIGVRLVKGAYWDQEQAWALERGWPMPCFTDKAATDAHYETLTGLLLAHTDTLLPAIAGHNPRSLAVALAHARQRGLSASQWEVQMLHGMADPLRAALLSMEAPVRVYVPTGDLFTGMAYLIRRLLENTASTSVLRQTWLEESDDSKLLRSPQPSTHPPAQTPSITLPLSDFSRAEIRTAFAADLATLQKNLPLNHGHDFVSRNPHHPAQVLGGADFTSLDQLDAIVTAAHAAQAAWAFHPFEKRIRILRQLADHIAHERHRFAALQVLEAGKSWREADADVAEAVDFLRYYGTQMLALSGPHTTVNFPGEHNHYRYQPRGVAAVISPWNFPLAILTGMTAAALVTGNAALMKPALPGLQSALALRAAMDAVGIPSELCPLLIGDADLGRALVAHPAVEIIAFTGSRAVGLDILHAAHTPQAGQRHVKQVVCEMGGKNAIVVDADADLDEAVSGILASAFGYSGQKCSACSRVIAVKSIAPALQERLLAAAATLRWGDPADPACDHGPLITAAARQKALDYIAIGRQEAHLLWQGNVPDTGWYCPPTIFAGVKPEHRLAREEIFGPVLALLTAPDFATALAIANDSDYALTGGVYSRLPRHLALAQHAFRVGNLYLNRRTTGARVGVQPFGGIALSGTGIQAGGPDYLKQFMWMQSSSENIMRKGFVPGGT